MADLIVGRSEGVAYSNNNLTYNQFKQPIKPIQATNANNTNNVSFIESMVKKIKQAQNDNDIKEVLSEVYFTTQWDSQVRAEFDNYYISVK